MRYHNSSFLGISQESIHFFLQCFDTCLQIYKDIYIIITEAAKWSSLTHYHSYHIIHHKPQVYELPRAMFNALLRRWRWFRNTWFLRDGVVSDENVSASI